MASFNLGFHIESFDPETCNWNTFVKRIKNKFVLHSTPPPKQVLALLDSLSYEVFEQLCYMCHPREPDKMSLDEVVDLLREKFQSWPSKYDERCKFHNRVQQENESRLDYANELEELAQRCRFPSIWIQEALITQFIVGVRSEALRSRLCKTNFNAFRDLVEFASECVCTPSDALHHNGEESAPRPQSNEKVTGPTRSQVVDERNGGPTPPSVNEIAGKGASESAIFVRSAKRPRGRTNEVVETCAPSLANSGATNAPVSKRGAKYQLKLPKLQLNNFDVQKSDDDDVTVDQPDGRDSWAPSAPVAGSMEESSLTCDGPPEGHSEFPNPVEGQKNPPKRRARKSNPPNSIPKKAKSPTLEICKSNVVRTYPVRRSTKLKSASPNLEKQVEVTQKPSVTPIRVKRTKQVCPLQPCENTDAGERKRRKVTTGSPRKKPSDHPGNKDDDSLVNKQNDSPGIKQNDSPGNKQNDSLGNKQNDSPKNKQNDSPKNKQTDNPVGTAQQKCEANEPGANIIEETTPAPDADNLDSTVTVRQNHRAYQKRKSSGGTLLRTRSSTRIRNRSSSLNPGNLTKNDESILTDQLNSSLERSEPEKADTTIPESNAADTTTENSQSPEKNIVRVLQLSVPDVTNDTTEPSFSSSIEKNSEISLPSPISASPSNQNEDHIWRGELKWSDKTESGNPITRHVRCSITIEAKENAFKL